MALRHWKRSFWATLLICLFGPVGAAAAAKTIYVPDSFPTIQAAIAAAANGDSVVVRDGTYTGAGNINLDFHGKAITVKSEHGPAHCIIDCGRSGNAFDLHSRETPASVISGFTIINGDIYGRGGAIQCEDASPTITHCILSGNRAVEGGGIYCKESSPHISHCTIVGNSAYYGGGGIYCYFHSSPLVKDCIIVDNHSRHQRGGGIGCFFASAPTLVNCLLYHNTAIAGGGISCLGSSPTLVNCTICNNKADQGGGFFCQRASPVVVNSIIYGNVPDAIRANGATPHVSYCDIQGGYPGTGNIDAGPRFVDPAKGDFQLQKGSPCIDSGTNHAPVRATRDLNGRPRGLDGSGGGRPVIDMGAYEYSSPSLTGQ